MNGKVKFFGDKGFGFIIGDDEKEYFVHQTGLNEGVVLHENDDVTFDVEEGDRGLKAVNVSIGSGSSNDSDEEAAEEPAEEAEEKEE